MCPRTGGCWYSGGHLRNLAEILNLLPRKDLGDSILGGQAVKAFGGSLRDMSNVNPFSRPLRLYRYQGQS
jgi:hypothetical protein